MKKPANKIPIYLTFDILVLIREWPISIPFSYFRYKNKKTEEQLPILRKKILAEIALSADGYIIAEGKVFTRDEVLKYFDKLKNAGIYTFMN